MKRVFVVIREFSYENKEDSFVLIGYPKAFTTMKNAKNSIEYSTRDTGIISEEEGCIRFDYRITLHTKLRTNIDIYTRWAIISGNI